jgi:DNA-directed RNA polymerase specialized sigma24 family protein
MQTPAQPSPPFPLQRIVRNLSYGFTLVGLMGVKAMGSDAVTGDTTVDSFTEFVRDVEPRLRRALGATLGVDQGLDATAEALAYGWEHWSRVSGMDNPAGYLYRVGKHYGMRHRNRPIRLPRPPEAAHPWVEPALPAALDRLSEKQRVAVLLTKSFQWTFEETAEVLGVSIGTVEKHVERGMGKLRRALRGGMT